MNTLELDPGIHSIMWTIAELSTLQTAALELAAPGTCQKIPRHNTLISTRHTNKDPGRMAWLRMLWYTGRGDLSARLPSGRTYLRMDRWANMIDVLCGLHETLSSHGVARGRRHTCDASHVKWGNWWGRFERRSR